MPAIPLILGALGRLVQSWQGILAIAGMALTAGFVWNRFLADTKDAILELWPIAALGFTLLLIREFMKNYFELKKEQLRHRDR